MDQAQEEKRHSIYHFRVFAIRLKSHRLAFASVSIPLLTYLAVCCVALEIYIFSESGSRQGLMGVSILVFGLSAISSFCAISLGAFAALRESPRFYGLFGIILGLLPLVGLSPFHLGGFLIRLVANIKGLDIYPG